MNAKRSFYLQAFDSHYIIKLIGSINNNGSKTYKHIRQVNQFLYRIIRYVHSIMALINFTVFFIF